MRKSSHDLQNLNYYQLKLSPFSNRHDLHALLYFSKKYHEHFLKVHNVLEFIRRLFSGTGCSINTINKQCDGIQNKRVEHDPFFHSLQKSHRSNYYVIHPQKSSINVKGMARARKRLLIAIILMEN